MDPLGLNPQDPTEAVIRNLFRLQRLANGLTGDARKIVKALIADTIADLARLDPTAVQLRYRQGRVDKVLDNLAERSAAAFADIRRRTRNNLALVGRTQADWAGERLLGEIALGGAADITVTAQGLGVNFFKKVIDTDPFEGHTMQQWLDMADRSLRRRVRGELNRGLLNGETLDQINRRMRRTVLKRSVRETETVVRTATNFVANRAHMELFERNSDITQRYEYVAVLDGKTSPICRALDGTTYKYGEGPRPPQHPNCRSITNPVIDWKGLGLPEPPDGTRSSVDGPVPSNLTYEQWLRGDEARARSILGPSRFDLFWNKGKTLRDMVREDGSVIRVDELVNA